MRAHRIPDRTVALGQVLDLVVDQGAERVKLHASGWWLLTTVDAMDRAPGYARIFLVQAAAGASDSEPGAAAADTYRQWHERDPSEVLELQIPSSLPHALGRLETLGYRSDKWSTVGDAVDYEHDFYEDGGTPPRLYGDRAQLADCSALLAVGGTMTITARGIA